MKKVNLIFMLCLFLVISCVKEKETKLEETAEKEIPSEVKIKDFSKLEIAEITNVEVDRATISVLIQSNGNSKITKFGVAVSTINNPTINDKIIEGNVPSLNELIAIDVDDLKSNTNYFLRPFSKNEKGISYGKEVVLKTPFRIGDVILVKGGTFKMGNNNEEDGETFEQPVHEVTLQDFKIRINEVTNLEFATFLNENLTNPMLNYWMDFEQSEIQIEKIGSKYQPKRGKENYPVIFVRYFGARDYAKWDKGRLPTEAEFEYVARGGNKSKNYVYAGSNILDEVGWHKMNSRSTQQVAQKKPNELGVYDMTGNVWEWTTDTWHKNYKGAPTDGTAWKGGRGHILRGGSWQSSKYDCRATYRTYNSKYYIDNCVGFRVVYDIK